MIKLNLLNTSEEKIKPQVVEELSEEISDDFFSSVEDNSQPNFEEEISLEPEVEASDLFQVDKIKEEPVVEKADEDLNIVDEFEDDIEKAFDGKNLYKILGIAGAAALALLIFFVIMPWLSGSGEETPIVKTPPVEQSTPPVDTQPTEQPVSEETSQSQTSNLPSAVQRLYEQNSANNAFSIQLADKALNINSQNAMQSMIVVTDDNVYTSVIGTNNAAIESYQKQLQTQLKASPKKQNSGSKQFNGRNGVFADFSMKTSGSGSGGSISTNQILSENSFETNFRALVKAEKLRLLYYKAGSSSKSGSFKQRSIVTRITGNKTAIMSFLETLNSQYPSVKFDKVSLFDRKGATLKSSNVQLNLNMIFYSPN